MSTNACWDKTAVVGHVISTLPGYVNVIIGVGEPGILFALHLHTTIGAISSCMRINAVSVPQTSCMLCIRAALQCTFT